MTRKWQFEELGGLAGCGLVAGAFALDFLGAALWGNCSGYQSAISGILFRWAGFFFDFGVLIGIPSWAILVWDRIQDKRAVKA